MHRLLLAAALLAIPLWSTATPANTRAEGPAGEALTREPEWLALDEALRVAREEDRPLLIVFR